MKNMKKKIAGVVACIMCLSISAAMATSASASVTDTKHGGAETGTLTHSWNSIQQRYTIDARTSGTKGGTPWTGLDQVRASNGQLLVRDVHQQTNYLGGKLDFSGFSPAVGNVSFFGSHEMRGAVGSTGAYTGVANRPW